MWHAAHVACLYLSPRMEPALMRQDKAPRATRTRQQRQRRAVHQADSKEAATRQAGKRAARLYLRGAGVRQESRSPHEASSGGTGPVELPGEANHGAVAEGTAQSKQSSGSRSCEKSEQRSARWPDGPNTLEQNHCCQRALTSSKSLHGNPVQSGPHRRKGVLQRT